MAFLQLNTHNHFIFTCKYVHIFKQPSQPYITLESNIFLLKWNIIFQRNDSTCKAILYTQETKHVFDTSHKKCVMWGSCGNNEDYCLLGCYNKYFGRHTPVLQGRVLSPFHSPTLRVEEESYYETLVCTSHTTWNQIPEHSHLQRASTLCYKQVWKH